MLTDLPSLFLVFVSNDILPKLSPLIVLAPLILCSLLPALRAEPVGFGHLCHAKALMVCCLEVALIAD